jgi:hypothetical protein
MSIPCIGRHQVRAIMASGVGHRRRVGYQDLTEPVRALVRGEPVASAALPHQAQEVDGRTVAPIDLTRDRIRARLVDAAIASIAAIMGARWRFAR